MDTLTRYAEADDTKDPSDDGKANSPKKGESSKNDTRFQGRNRHNQGANGKRRPQVEPSDLVANTNAYTGNQRQKKNRGFSGKRPRNYEELLKGPCPHHATADGPATHSWENFFVMREFRIEAIKKSQSDDPDQRQEQFAATNQRCNPSRFSSGLGGPHPSSGQYPVHHQWRYNPPGAFYQPPPQGAPQGQHENGGFRSNPKQLSNGQYHVFTTNACRRDKKVSHRAYSRSRAFFLYLHWSEQTISWSREDHPPRVDNLGDLALVVAPQVGGYTLSKVLMDGGSSINILYFDIFQRMNLLEKDLMPSTTVFHGIVPGKSAYPIGRVRLTVAFGTAQNYRSESLIFEVVKLKSPYHALFGRPAYARFMARPCYVYLKLKMPGPKGPITVEGDRRIAKECEEGDAAYAEVACAAEELKHHRANAEPADMSPLKKPTTDAESPLKFKPTDDTKTIDFVPGDSSKKFTIGTGLDPK
ncbi:hypothetical protein ZWY2020_049171 [Hordeum vulgare]|nr:hypothetical protein ZWY2020_049171 [Hordeum vulgare]